MDEKKEAPVALTLTVTIKSDELEKIMEDKKLKSVYADAILERLAGPRSTMTLENFNAMCSPAEEKPKEPSDTQD